MKISALLKITTPLHITAPGDKRADPATGEIVFNDKATPLIAAQKMPVINPKFAAAALEQRESDDRAAMEQVEDDAKTPGAAQKKDSVGDRNTVDLPVIAANNLAGHLRRHAASIVLDVLRSRGEHVSLPVYSSLMSGAWTGRPDASDMNYGEYVQAKAHPYLGLFGGGPRMMRKGFATFNALPALSWVREFLSIPHVAAEVMPDIPAYRLTKIFFFRHNDDLADLSNITQLDGTVKNSDELLTKYHAALLEDKPKDEGGKPKNRVSCFAFSSIEVVLPGTTFDVNFELRDDLTDAQVGLFLLTLDRFAQTDTLGGWGRNGFGRFAFSAVETEGERLFDAGRLNRSNSWVVDKLSAWEQAAQDMSAAQLEYLLRRGEDSREKKAKKAKGEDTPAKDSAFSQLEDALAANT